MVNRGEEKVRVRMNVVPRSTMNTNGETENDDRSPWSFSRKWRFEPLAIRTDPDNREFRFQNINSFFTGRRPQRLKFPSTIKFCDIISLKIAMPQRHYSKANEHGVFEVC